MSDRHDNHDGWGHGWNGEGHGHDHHDHDDDCEHNPPEPPAPVNQLLVGTPIGDSLIGGAGNDIIIGLQARDFLVGGAGDDRISGGQGMDILLGGVGADTLVGGRDNDNLSGGLGDDVFVFVRGGGFDRVRDFTQAADVLDVSRLPGIDGLDDLTITDRAGGTLIVADSGERVFLNGFHGALTADDFAF